MASDIRIPDPVTVKKEEDEDSYLINEQCDKIQKEIYKMEEEKLDQLLNQPPGVGDFPFDTIGAELNDEIKTKDNEILVTSHLEQVGNEEKCTSDPCPTSIPKEDETEMPGNEKQFHKCDHNGDAKEKEEYEAVVVNETCENSMQNIDEQEVLHDIKTSSPVSKVEEDIIVEKEDSSKDELNVDQNVEKILDQQTFVDNNDKPQNIHEERNGSELELKNEASAESTINILNDDIETVTEITNAEDSPCSDVGMKTELKVGDCTEISCDSKVEKATEMSRDTEIEKDEEPSTSNADDAFDVAMPEVQNDEVTMETGINTEAKLQMLSVSEDTDEGSKQEGTLALDEFTNQTETREKITQDNSIPNEGDDAEFSEQKLDSINVERQVDLQEMNESTTNDSEEVEELTATATGDYIDGSQNTKAVQDLEHKYFKENDLAEETTSVAVNEGLEENETETPREISEAISNEGEKQITNLEETSSGIEKEHIEAAYFGGSKDDVPTEEELLPSNLNEVHDSANELSGNNGNDVQLVHSLLQETEKVEDQKVEDQKVDEVLEFENEQKIQEGNAMTEEEKYVDNVSKAYPNTEHTTGEIESLDKTVTNEMISEDGKVSGSGQEEKIKSSEIRVYVPKELESTEDTETSVQRSTTKDNKIEQQIAVDDALTTESRNTLIEEEIVEKSFEEQDYEEATLNPSGEDEKLSPNEIEKKKTHVEEGSDNIDTENIKEEALVKSKDACFSPETNEVDGSSEKEVEKLREEDIGRSILDEADEKYVGEVVDGTCENSMQVIDEQEALHDRKTSSPVSKVEEDIIVEKEDSSKDEINVDQNVEKILYQQTFVDNNDKPQNIHGERYGSELELKKEASAESTINILNDDIETVTEITNAEDSPCSRRILDEEDVGMKTELKVGDCTEISCDSKVEKATEMSRDTEIEKDEESSTSNADDAFDVAMPEVQNDEVTMETGISAEAKLQMLSVSEDTDEGSKQEGMLASDEFTNQTETREKITQDNSIPSEGDDAEFSEQKLDSITVERQVDMQEMTESTTNESEEVEELAATATGDYIDGSQNAKAVQDLEHKYFKENDLAEETTLVAVNEGLEVNETETPREISEAISNEGEKQITNLEETSSGIEKEHIEAAYFGASKDDVPTEEEISPSNLNEVHDGANALSGNNGNDVQLEHSLLQETEKVEHQKVDEMLEFENEQKIQEANTMTEEEKYVDNISEAYPNTKHTTGEIKSLDKTVTNEMISEIKSSSVEDGKVSGSGQEEKIKSSEIKVYVPEELESTEDTETFLQRSTIKDNKTEEQIAVDDALTTESRNALIEEEIVEKSFEERDYEEATLNLSGEDENLSPNEIEKKKTHDEEGSDNIDTENIKEEALVKSKDACFSPDTNEVDGSSEKEVEKLKEEDIGRSILDEADEKYVGEEVIKHYEDENEDIEISKGEIFGVVENVTGEKFITNEKNEDVETHDKCFNIFKTEEDVAFSEEHDLLAIREASMEESRNDSTCPTKEVVADNIIDNTTENSERQAMVAEEVAEKVLDEGKSKEEPVNFVVARESETETLSGNDQIISAAEKYVKQIMQKDDSGGELMQPLVIDETETEVLRKNAYNETLAVEDLEENKQTETEACFDSTVVSEKDTEQILQKDETSEEIKQLQFTNEIEEKASCDNAENETSVAREDVEKISHQEETMEELEQLLETKKFESEESCRDTEIIKLEDYTEKDSLNEVTKKSVASCGDIEITVPKEDAEQVLLKEAANDIVQPQAPNETETEVFSENVKEILAVEELQETKKIETEAISDSTIVAEKYTERSLAKVETIEEVQQLQLTNEEILVAREDTAQILHQDEPKKELDHFEETQKIESEEHCKDEEVIAPEEDTQVVLKEVTKELDQSLVINKNEMAVFSGSSEIVVNEKDTKQICQNIESVEEFENVPETGETETEDNKDTENLQKDETREEVKDLLLTSELEAKTICKDDEKETLVAEDDAEKDTGTNLQTHETKEELVKLINANETKTEVFHGDIETTLAEKDIDQICQKNESTEEIEQYLGIKESNTEGFGDSSGIAIDEKSFEETLQKEESREELEQLQASKDIETEAEKVCGNTEIDTVMGERGSEEPFEIGESSEKFERSIVTPEPAVKRDVDEDIITSIGGEETAKKEVIETARECHENVILDEINRIKSQSQEIISEEITTKDFQNDGNAATGYKELEIEDIGSIEQENFKENTTASHSSTSINETITESSEKENSDTVELKQESQLEFKEQNEVQNSKEISADNIQLQEDPDTKALDEEIHIEEMSENLAQNLFSESKVNEEEMQEESQEKEKEYSSFVSILSEEKISKEELEIKELSNEEGTDLGTSNINVEEERDSKSENEKDKDISIVAYETENQIEYETDYQVHPTTIKNDQEVIIEEATLHHTPDYKLTDLSTLPSKELDIETTEASNATENVTIDVEGEEEVIKEVENPLKEQEIENKRVQEADESFTQRDLSEMGSSDIVQNSAPSEIQQQRDEELYPPPETENQIEYEADDQVHLTTIKNDHEVIIEEATFHHTPDYKLTDLSTLPSKEPDIETTEASYITENVTVDAEAEDIINEEVENPLKEQEIENKLVQEADKSFTQRDLSQMGSLEIVQNSAPSEVQQQRDEELHPPPEIDRRSAFDSNEVANLNKEELIDFEKQHEVIDDKNYLESAEAGEDDSKQILHSEKSEDIEKLLENKITETEAFVAEKDTGEGHQETEVIETAGECKENVISDEIDSTKSQSQETVNDEITLEYFQKDETDAIGINKPETELSSLTEQENFKENVTAILSSMPINETTTESSENENSDALKLKQELQLESKEQIEVENWNELQKDLDTKEATNEEIHVEERSENVAQNLLSESKVYEAETQEGTQEKEDSDSSFVSITERDLPEMGSDQKSAPSEVQKQRDPKLHPSEIDTSTSESNEVANLDKEELADFQNQYEVVDDKNNLQSEELEEVIFENQYEVVDDKNNLESEDAAKDDSKGILQNEKSMEEIEQLIETKITETEALVAEKDTREGFKETETSVAEKDSSVVEKDSSASNEMGNVKKEELDFENEYEIVDDKNNLELEGETSKREEPSEQPNEHNATNLNSLNDQYSIGDNPTSELNMTCTDFAETSRSIELEEATAAVEVVSQGVGHDDSTVQFNELPTKEVFDTNRTGKEAKEETMEDVDTIKINSPEITELDTFEKNFEDDQEKETNLESDIRIEPPEALNEETSNQESNESYVASFVSQVSDKEVKEVRKDELIIDDCKPSIANSESENSGLIVAESEEKDMVEDKIVLDSTAIDNKPESEQKDITNVGTMLDFSAEERRDNDIAAVVEGKEEGGEYEMEEKLGILTENTCTKEGNKNLSSTESKMTDQDFEEEISINDYDSPSAKFGSEDLTLKAPELKEQEAETKEDQSVMEIKPEDISILCKEKEDTTTLVVEGIDNRDHDIEETTPTKVVVEENILPRSFDFRSDDNLPESVEIPSDKHQLVETKITEKVEDIVVRDEASYGNFEPEEKLNTPAEDTCTKEGDENLNASIESKVFDEEIKEEIISKEEVSTSDFDSASTKFESGDLTLKVVESEEQKIQTINDQSAMEIKPEDNSILCKEIDDEKTTLAVESMANQDHDIEETIPTKVIVEENILTRSFDFTSDSNLQETVEIPSSENQLIASETPEKVEKNIVRDEASYGNFEPEATSPTQTIEEGTCTKEGDENPVASPQSKVPDDEIKEIVGKEEISVNDYDSPSTKFERKDLSLKVVESEEQELQTKEDQTIDTKQEDEDIVTLAVESMDNREYDIEETTSKEVVVDENVLIRSFDSTGDNFQDSAKISSDKDELKATETTDRVDSEETEHVMEEVHKAVAEEAFLTTSSDTLNDNDCHDSFVVLSAEHLPTASEMIEEKVSKSGIDDSPYKFNELELSKGKVEISTFVGKENDIIEQEDGYNFKDNTLDLGEGKAAIVFREGDQGQEKEVAEIKEKSLLEEKNVEIDGTSETLECATELVNEDQNIQSKMSEAEEDIKQKNPTSVEQQILEQSQEDEITSTKMEATLTNEKVCDEIIKTDSRENNEEQDMQSKSTLEELHMISSQGAVNESCEVSEDYMREINSNEKAGTIKSESEEDITSQRETTITETKQEERVMSECMEPPVNISVSVAEESEGKNTREMRNDLEDSPSDEATVETRSASPEAMEADSSFETNTKVAPSLLETQKLMDDPNTSNIPFKISAQASEDEQEVCIDEILSKSKDSEIEEKHQGIAVTSLNTTENEYEKRVEESMTTENKVPSEEALEQNKFKEDHYQILLNEDSKKEDVAEEINEPLKSTSEVYYQDVVKLSEVIDEGATEKEKADEHRMLEEVTKKESFTDEENNEYLKEEETEVDREIQGKTEAITKEKESRVDMLELEGPENSADDNIISKDIYQTKELAPEISGKKLNQTEEISEEGIKTRSVVGDPMVNFGPLTEPPIENEGQERQDAKEEDREVKEHEHGDSSKDNLCEVRAEESISTDLEKVVSAEHKQSSVEENEPVDRTMAENTERTIKSGELEDEKLKGAHVGDSKIEGAHVGDSGTDEEKGDKHDKDAVSDAPVIVEASKDIDVKVGHKKSHNILSGVGSKVKHSISKVKKAITGKSSHHKSESPK